VNPSKTGNGFGPGITLDALFTRNAATRGEAYALIDSGGKRYSYDDALRAANAVAAQLSVLRLPLNSSVALLLPNGAELVLSILGIIRAGHIPVPMPVAWRKHDVVQGCREAEASVLLTTANYSAENLPQLAAEAAMEAFELSFPCAFGLNLPDGITPFSLTAEAGAAPDFPAAASAGIATLHTEIGGLTYVLHRDEEMLAAGLSAMLAADVQNADKIVSAVSPASYGGIVSALVPWLLSGGILDLVADSSEIVPAGSARTHLVATAGASAPLAKLLSVPLASITAIHSGLPVLTTQTAVTHAERMVDTYAIGEFAVVSLRRTDPAEQQPVPLAPIVCAMPDAGVLLETKFDAHHQLLIRGSVVPMAKANADGWVETGYSARKKTTDGFFPENPKGIISIGALRFSFPDLERRILGAALVAQVSIVDDPILGRRLVIESDRPEVTSQALMDAGLPRVIANATRKGLAQKARA
jgi:hypothetical protein